MLRYFVARLSVGECLYLVLCIRRHCISRCVNCGACRLVQGDASDDHDRFHRLVVRHDLHQPLHVHVLESGQEDVSSRRRHPVVRILQYVLVILSSAFSSTYQFYHVVRILQYLPIVFLD